MSKRKSEHKLLEEIIKNATEAALAEKFTSPPNKKNKKDLKKQPPKQRSELELCSVESDDESNSLQKENQNLKEEVKKLQQKCYALEQENSDLRSSNLRLKVLYELDLAVEQLENVTCCFKANLLSDFRC